MEGKNINKGAEDSDNIIEQQDQTDPHRTFHPTAAGQTSSQHTWNIFQHRSHATSQHKS